MKVWIAARAAIRVELPARRKIISIQRFSVIWRFTDQSALHQSLMISNILQIKYRLRTIRAFAENHDTSIWQ